MTFDRSIKILGIAIAVLALGATGLLLTERLLVERTISGDGLIAAPADLGGPFALTDHTGREVTQKAFAGTLTLVYFGYSFCPDVCPTALQKVALALNDLGPRAEQVSAAFISVDPERDTPAHLADYVGLFHERIVGLSGPKNRIDAVTKRFRVYYALRRDIDPEDYPVDHSSYTYLMDRDWKLIAIFRHDATPENIADALRQVL